MSVNAAVVLGAVLLLSPAVSGQTALPNLTQVGGYGPWLADEVLGNAPGRLSFRTGKWKSVEEWRQAARKRALECIAPVNLGGPPAATVVGRTTYDEWAATSRQPPAQARQYRTFSS